MDTHSVIVTCNGVELLSWIFEFPQQASIEKTLPEVRGSVADCMRDDNLRDVFED